MLERIPKIISIGLFNDIRPSSIGFKKLSLIYGDNGRGKSTFSSIIRSYSHQAPSVITTRKTINSTIDQFAELLFSNGNRAKFENGQWNSKFSDAHVFDLDFIESNVYSGGEIKPGHRKKFLSFALGESAVTAKNEFNVASEEAAECSRQKRDAENLLSGYRGSKTTAQYIRLSDIDDIDNLISANVDEQAKCHRIDTIKSKSKIKSMTVFSPNIDEFFNITEKTVVQINDEVEKYVNAHFERIKCDGLEKWINDGQAYAKDGICPFCAQDISNSEIISYYKEYFNDEYSNFIKEITTLTTKKDNILSCLNIPLLKQQREGVKESIETWNEYIKLNIDQPNFEELEKSKSELEHLLADAIATKTQSPLEKIADTYKESCSTLINSISKIITEQNEAIAACNTLIDEYKTTLENINIESLTEEQTRLNIIKTRFSEVVVDLIADFTTKKTNETAATSLRETKRTALNTIMTETLSKYENSINDALSKFGALFRIKEVSFNYSGGGEPRSEYAIELRGQNISLQGEDSGFKTCLSEGDKRTLAFAFFISVIKEDENLINKIVVVDDPMCSFDTHRKQQTITVLKDVFDKSKQLIILAHDAFFIKSLRDEMLRKTGPENICLIKITSGANQYSDFRTLNLDEECESAYYKNHRLVTGYLNGEPHNERDVATAIRPLLEGYLHRRFPRLISQGKLFGEIVTMINNASTESPLHYALPISEELSEINSYAGKFHHDTNANAGSEPISTGELNTFCKRALRIIYSGSN